MKKCDWGWQGEAKKLRLRAEYLLMNLASLPIPADITFQFDKDGSVETLSAHKIFLAIGSEVFMAMFYGPAADATQTKVQIPNYSKTVFQALIHFLYSDRIPRSFYASWYDDSMWMELLECATQYGVPELATKCRRQIVIVLTLYHDADVCKLLSEARRLDEEELEQTALDELDKRPLEILSCSSDISKDLMSEIVQRSELNIRDDQEIELYNAVRRWAMDEDAGDKQLPDLHSEACDTDDCMVKSDPVGQPRDPVFQHIRFPLMSPSLLADGLMKDGILTSAEISQLTASDPKASFNADFASSSRRTKLSTETGEVCLEFKVSGTAGAHLMPAMDLTVVPDWKTCPDTSRRFMDLCKEGYQFALEALSGVSLDHAVQAKFDTNPSPAIQDLFLPLPTSEDSLMHDSGGTVSLCLVKNDKGDGSYYKLFISPDKKLTNTGTVFGRLLGWEVNLEPLESFPALIYYHELCDMRDSKFGLRACARTLEPYWTS